MWRRNLCLGTWGKLNSILRLFVCMSLSLSFYISSSPTSALTHALNGRKPLAPSESLLEHTNRIFRVARLHKRQDSPTSRQRPERYTCRIWAHLFPIINELPIRKIKEKSLCSWNLGGCAPPIESIKYNCSRDVVIYVLYSLTLMRIKFVQSSIKHKPCFKTRLFCLQISNQCVLYFIW